MLPLAASVFSNETELGDAIECYNTAGAPASYRITLDQNIVSSGTFSSGSRPASFPWITQSGAGFDLTIDGAGFAVAGNPTTFAHVVGESCVVACRPPKLDRGR